MSDLGRDISQEDVKMVGMDDLFTVGVWKTTKYPMEVRNAFKNYELLNRMHKIGRAVPMQEQYHKNTGRALILGSGSSLDKHIKKLKDWPGTIFCSTSNLSTLKYYGVDPEYVAVIDPAVAKTPEFQIPGHDWGKTIMAVHPSAAPDYLTYWAQRSTNEFLLFRLLDARMEWYQSTLYYAYEWIQSLIMPFLESLSCQIGMAAYLGYEPIYLLGADFVGDRFIKYYYDKNKWIVDPPEVYEPKHSKRGNANQAFRTNDGLITYRQYLNSKRGPVMQGISHMLHKRIGRIYNLGYDKSLLKEYPAADFDEIVRTGEDPKEADYNLDMVIQDLKAYLAFTNTFAVSINSGLGPATSFHSVVGEDDLKGRLVDLNNQLAASKAYYQGLMKQTGNSLKELAEDKNFGDPAQNLAAMNMDPDAIRGIDVDAYMKYAKELKAAAEEKYWNRLEVEVPAPGLT